jgi:CubicO group peptidase (beta-lactamase class C family)
MRNKLLSIVSSLIFFFSVSTGCTDNSPLSKTDPESVGFSDERLQRLDKSMHGLVDEGKLSGIVTCVARHGRIVHQSAYGKRDMENNRPMRMDTIFRLYSMTKPVTGVAMMILYEEGKWDPGDPLATHFPEFKDLMAHAGVDALGKDILEKPRRVPTVGDIMTHTAGFTYGQFGDSPVDKLYQEVQPMDVESMDEFIKRMAGLPLLYHPGEAWVYSVSADIQGALIERLSGMSLADFMRTRIFEPLKMKDTAFFVPKGKLDRLATVYTAEEEGLKPVPHDANVTAQPGFQSGGGGLYSTAGDFLRFAQMLINEGELDGVRLLAPGTVRLMRGNQLSEKLMTGGFGIGFQQFRPGFGFGYDVAVFTDPAKAGSTTGKGTYLWDGAAGTWFWNDTANEIVFIGLIQRMWGLAEPNIENLSRTLVHQAPVHHDK